ncbi:11714_t:CDS:2 [Racocetra fulgida]|uniref:11714_t:CDS:1 n=1 Tax=Racocetra fulgida TaxID=60492 RepID=A0A9N9AN40_9GLOM|nr:11714_t:CDS:2 [Racocetra fulgida]
MSAQQSRPEGYRISAPDGTGSLGGAEATIKQLRSQNDQLWKIIEKQKTIITNLQKDNQKLAHERDKLLIRIRDIDTFERSEENIIKGGNEIKVISDNVNNNTSTSDAIRIRTSTPPPHTSRLSKSFPQVQKQQIETELLTQNSQLQHQDSETLIISETTSSLNVSNESNSRNLPPVVVHEPSPERLNFEHEKDSEHQLDETPSRSDSKSASSQNDIVTLNSTNTINPRQSLLDNNILGSPIDMPISPSPLNLDQSSQNSRLQHTHSSHQNPPSPSMSTKSSESESLSSGSCSRHRRHSTIQTIDTELDILEDTDAHVQFPQPPSKDSSTKPSNQHINIQSSEGDEISDIPQDSSIQSLKKVPEPLGLAPLTQKLGTPQRSPGLPSSPKAYMYSNDEQAAQRTSNESDATASSRNVIINQDNLNYNKYLQSFGHNQVVDRSQPIRSHSLPTSDDKTSHEKSEDERSWRDSQASNNESLDTSLKDRSLRASRSFSHVPTGPRSRISMMPPPHGGYPEFRNPNPNNVSLPNQGQIDNPSVNLSQGQQWQSFQSHPQQTTASSSQQSQLSPRSETSTPSITSDAISGIAVKVVGSNKKTNDKGKEVLTFIISVGQARVVDGRIVGMEKELHLGSIRLTHAQIGRQQSSNDTDKDNENSYRHAFLILEPKPGSKTQNTRHVLCAESDAERDEWVEALLQYVGVTEEEAQRRRQKKEKEKQIKDTNKAERKKGNNDSISSTSVSVSQIQKRASMLEEIERIRKYSGTPEPRDVSPSSSQVVAVVSSNNSSLGQSSTRRDRPHDDQIAEKRKNSRKTFFGSMFGSKDDKKKYNEIRPDISKIVFGIPLDQAIAVARIKEGCIEYLDANDADKEEGIYRLSGAAMTLKHLKDRFNSEGDVDLLNQGEYYDVHAVAGLLKLYLRELPTSVLTRELHMEFVNVVDLLDRRDRINELGRLVSSLPLANYTLLRALTGHLIRIVQNSDINKMTVRNIGIVFSPTLGIPADSDGVAAPKTIEATPENHEKDYYQPSTNDFSSESTSDNQQLTNVSPNEDTSSPTALSPKTALRKRDIREEITGRSNRNSVHYMDSAPEVVVGLERSLRRNERNDDSSEEEVNDLALQVEDVDYDAESVSSASVEEFVASSPPDSSNLSLSSPRILAPPSPRTLAPSLQLPESNYYEMSDEVSETQKSVTGYVDDVKLPA